MAYQFAGFFARPQIDPPALSPTNGVWRTIEVPFVGSGVRLPDWLDQNQHPSLETIHALAEQLGFTQADSWIYLNYNCWGGCLDSVYGFSHSAQGELGPIAESEDGKTQPTYERLMHHFGVSAEDARDFAPFRRHFWGEP